MAQHFLLSAKARTLSLKEIYKMGEDNAYKMFCELRWPQTHGKAVCPKCGHDESYNISTRRKFKCKACHRQFSVTSGTIFASRKMDFTDLLAAICIIVNGAKGISAVQLSRDLDCQYKTAFVLAHKIREAMAAEYDEVTLSGEVEIDGAWFGGHIRPENRVEDRKDRRLAKHQTGKRRSVVAARERCGRTLTSVCEHESEGADLIPEWVEEGSTIFSDEATHWDILHAKFDNVYRINHSEAYSVDGICTNQAESYFSRLRRMVAGQHHHVSGKYLHQYANHAAWLEDNRRLSNGRLAKKVIGLAMASPVSRNWKGYWQRSAS